MALKLKGLTAFVTGGASGLGAACVNKFLENGCKVLSFDRKVNEDIKLNDNNQLHQFTGDVTSEKDVEKAMEYCKNNYRGLHILTNCAGVALAQTTFNHSKNRSHNLEHFHEVMKVNTVGTFNVIRLAARLMNDNEPNVHEVEGQRGIIINTASIAAFDGQKGQVAYAASKAAIVGMTLPIARDLSSIGIRVVTIAPGFLRTKLLMNDYEGLFDTPLLSNLPEKVKMQLGTTVPFPSRLGRPEEYADMALAVVNNTLLNGTTIRLDGALRMPM